LGSGSFRPREWSSSSSGRIFAVGFLNGDGKGGDSFGFEIAVAGGQEIHLRDDEETGQVGELGFEFCFELKVGTEKDFGFEARIDFLFVARSFKKLQDLGADFGKSSHVLTTDGAIPVRSSASSGTERCGRSLGAAEDLGK